MSQHSLEHGTDRRTLIRRAAVLGAATAWATPTVQSLAGPAFAAGSQLTCGACMTGGGRIDGGTFNGVAVRFVTYGIGRICCDGSTDPEIRVTVHPFSGGSTGWIFKTNLLLTCSKTGNPAPPPQTAKCPNRFTGTAQTEVKNPKKPAVSTLAFDFQDFGEPGEFDSVSLKVTGPQGTLDVLGTRTGGNLQTHGSEHNPNVNKRECVGC